MTGLDDCLVRLVTEFVDVGLSGIVESPIVRYGSFGCVNSVGRLKDFGRLVAESSQRLSLSEYADDVVLRLRLAEWQRSSAYYLLPSTTTSGQLRPSESRS